MRSSQPQGAAGHGGLAALPGPGAHPCLSPHLHDVSEIAIALTQPWLALATTTAKASPEAGEPRPMWGADPTRGARTVNREQHQSAGHGKGFLGWQQLSFASPPCRSPVHARVPREGWGEPRSLLSGSF